MPSPFEPPKVGDPFVPMPAPAGVDRSRGDVPLSRWKRPITHRWVVWVMAIIGTAWCAGLLGVYVGARIQADRSPTIYRASTQSPTIGGPRTAAFDKRIDVAAVTAELRPSIVSVSSDISVPGAEGEGTGTGVVLTEDGQIITNAHVVADATSVRVRLDGEREPRNAKVLATDPGNDLALLQIDIHGMTPAVLADPSTVLVGDDVVAIGYALDLDGDASVTLGIISALDRTLLTKAGALDGLIQTDAAISSGNSGGPLVNAAGQVVGINTAVAKSDGENTASNIGFAISIAQVLPEIDVLRDQADGSAKVAGFLGVELQERTDGGQGAIVTDVGADSPAAGAGIEAGDVVVQVDQHDVDGTGGVIGAIRDRSPGDTVEVTVERAGRTIDFDVTLAARPAEPG